MPYKPYAAQGTKWLICDLVLGHKMIIMVNSAGEGMDSAEETSMSQ